jgi:nucleotide-binding universal stress UspA family protein
MAPAIAATAAIASRHRARVTVLHVGTDVLGLTEDVAALWEATGCEPRRIDVDGRPDERIAEVAADLRASLVVMGSRMVPAESVSEAAGLHAPCSVLVMRGAS